jgi:hypothetical protein
MFYWGSVRFEAQQMVVIASPVASAIMVKAEENFLRVT